MHIISLCFILKIHFLREKTDTTYKLIQLNDQLMIVLNIYNKAQIKYKVCIYKKKIFDLEIKIKIFLLESFRFALKVADKCNCAF